MLVAACLSAVSAQQNPNAMIITYDPNIQQLSIGDIDFGNFGSTNFLFSININVSGSVRLKGSIDIVLDDGSVYYGAATLCTQPFNAPTTISNLDVGKHSSIKTELFDFSQQAKDELQKKALSIGKLPSGEYRFRIELWDAGDNCNSLITMYDSEEIILRLKTINRLDLIYPADNSILNTTFPMFQWVYEGTEVELSVYERLPHHRSKEEASSGVPQAVQMLSGTTSFQYPTSGVRPLENGKTYVWKVVGKTLGTGGVGSVINSEIWQFSISEITGSTESSSQVNNVVNQIQFLYGLSPELLSDLLSGKLQFSGVFLVDGKQVSVEEMLAILQELATNPDMIITVQVVDL